MVGLEAILCLRLKKRNLITPQWMEPPAVTSVVPQIEHRAELHQYLTSTILGDVLSQYFISDTYSDIHWTMGLGTDQLVSLQHSST